MSCSLPQYGQHRISSVTGTSFLDLRIGVSAPSCQGLIGRFELFERGQSILIRTLCVHDR
jgi:hypothetical protein